MAERMGGRYRSVHRERCDGGLRQRELGQGHVGATSRQQRLHACCGSIVVLRTGSEQTRSLPALVGDLRWRTHRYGRGYRRRHCLDLELWSLSSGILLLRNRLRHLPCVLLRLQGCPVGVDEHQRPSRQSSPTERRIRRGHKPCVSALRWSTTKILKNG